MRFQELRDEDGAVLARGLHPAIAVVAATAQARSTVTSSVRHQSGTRVVNAQDVEAEARRAEEQAQRDHDAALVSKRASVEEAEQSVRAGADAADRAARAAASAGSHLVRFDELANSLASAQEAYEAAVRADAEAARSLAAALAELDRTLGQRHSASTSLDQARKSRDNGNVPDAVIHQALNLQSALAKAEADRYAAVQQADDMSKGARAATREALASLEAALTALTAGIAVIASAPPAWGPGVPLPGLVGNYRDQLVAELAAAQVAESEAQASEAAAKTRLEQERQDLDDLTAVTLPLLTPQETIAKWVGGDDFDRDTAVIADDAFATFGLAGAASLITALSARGCQVIYLTEDPEVLGWAIGLPHEVGGASTVSSSKSRALASVSG